MNFGFFKDHKNENDTEHFASAVEDHAENNAAEEVEHYDGTTFKDLYPEQPRTDWEHSRGTAKNVPTRAFLQRVREIKREIKLLEWRATYRADAGLDTDDLENLITAKQEELKTVTAEVADEISKIGNVSQEMVLTMRYIDMKSWDEIAESMDLRVKTVLKFHGYGLVHMSGVLLADGLIEMPEDEAEEPSVERTEE